MRSRVLSAVSLALILRPVLGNEIHHQSLHLHIGISFGSVSGRPPISEGVRWHEASRGCRKQQALTLFRWPHSVKDLVIQSRNSRKFNPVSFTEQQFHNTFMVLLIEFLFQRVAGFYQNSTLTHVDVTRHSNQRAHMLAVWNSLPFFRTAVKLRNLSSQHRRLCQLSLYTLRSIGTHQQSPSWPPGTALEHANPSISWNPTESVYCPSWLPTV